MKTACAQKQMSQRRQTGLACMYEHLKTESCPVVCSWKLLDSTSQLMGMNEPVIEKESFLLCGVDPLA